MTFVVACPECDRRLKAPPTVVGKKIRCPSCEAVFLCQPDDEPAAEDEPKALRRDEEPEQSDDADAVEERPRRRRRRSLKKRSSAGLWIGLAVAGALFVLLIVGGGAALIYVALRRPSIPDADWVAFTTPDGACSVQMPGAPVLDNAALKNAPGNKYLLVRKQEDVFFAVAYVDLPAIGVTPALLTMASAGERDALQQKVGGTVIFDNEVTVLGYPGREFQIRAAPPHRGVLMERLFMVPNGLTKRLYIVGTGGSIIEPGTGAAAKFFDSLAIKATPAVALPLPINPPPVLQPPVLTKPKPNQAAPPNWQPPTPMLPKPKKS
jgi:hypothetical protein